MSLVKKAKACVESGTGIIVAQPSAGELRMSEEEAKRFARDVYMDNHMSEEDKYHVLGEPWPPYSWRN